MTLVIAERLAPDQRLLQDTAAEFIAQAMPLSSVRLSSLDDHVQYRSSAAELGWFSLLVPEDLGGGSLSACGVLDACLIAYQRGRVLQPGSFVATNVVARAVAQFAAEPQRTPILSALLTGSSAAGWAAPAAGSIEASRTNDTYRLTGRTAMIEDPGAGGIVLLTADTAEGPTQFLVTDEIPGLNFVDLGSLDMSRRFIEVRCDDAEVPADAVLGRPGAGHHQQADQLTLACVLVAAESVGAMDRDLEMAVQYAKDRVAFGRPIGSFQAIKHLLADTSLALELAKSCVVAAATHLDAGDGYAHHAASIAKALVGDNGQALAQNCFQVFGGIGFTWEHDQHLYLRRLTTDAVLYGDPTWHREHLCQLSAI